MMYPTNAPTVLNTDGFGGNNGILALLALLGVFRGGYGFGQGVDNSVQTQLNGVQTQLGTLQSEISSNLINGNISQLGQDINADHVAVAGAFRDLSTQVANANFTTLQSINGLGSTLQASMNQNQLGVLNGFNQQNVAFLQGINGLSAQNMNATNQIIMGQNALSSQLAACCCDIKQNIHQDGEETRALINSINLQNLNSQLTDAKTKNITLEQTITQQAITNAQTATILNHLKPYPQPIA